jgi:hypothetical protein
MFDFTKAYRVEGYGGVAWHVTGHEEALDEDYEWTGIKTVIEDRVVAHMVGDDENFTFGVDDLTPLEDDEFCSECGQIGCGHGAG